MHFLAKYFFYVSRILSRVEFHTNSFAQVMPALFLFAKLWLNQSRTDATLYAMPNPISDTEYVRSRPSKLSWKALASHPDQLLQRERIDIGAFISFSKSPAGRLFDKCVYNRGGFDGNCSMSDAVSVFLSLIGDDGQLPL